MNRPRAASALRLRLRVPTPIARTSPKPPKGNHVPRSAGPAALVVAAVVETIMATSAVPPPGVTLEGVNVQLDLDGMPEQANVMAASNAGTGVMVKCCVCDWPAVTVTSVSVADIEKSSTVNAIPLLAMLLTVTTTFPVVAPAGTFTTIEVALQVVAGAVLPLNVTVLVP